MGTKVGPRGSGVGPGGSKVGPGRSEVGPGGSEVGLETDRLRLGENCPVWNHRSSTPSGPLPHRLLLKT